MRFVIVTGMSGAGKSTALKMLEDMGYFCVDNLPIPLLPGFVQMLQNTDTEMKKVALGLDVRSGQDLSGLKENLEAMDRDRIGYEILFLEALQGDEEAASFKRIGKSGYRNCERKRKDSFP